MEISKQVNIPSPLFRNLAARSAQCSILNSSLRVLSLISDIRYMALAEQGKETLL